MPETAPAAKPQIIRGLEGVIIGQHALSFIDGERGILQYKGYPIQDLATQSSSEEVIYLLWYDRLPTEPEFHKFFHTLAENRALPEPALKRLLTLPKDAPPMAILRTIVSYLGLIDPDAEDNSPPALVRKATRLVAQFPTIAAAYDRYRRGLEPVAPRQDLGHAANFLYMLHGEEGRPEHAHALDAYMITTADHGMNASTFTARVIASTNSDYHSAIVGAIGALKGPAHGGAPTGVMEMFKAIQTPERAVPWIREQLAQGKRIMGIGHRVYKALDPRAAVLHKFAAELSKISGEPPWLKVAEATEDAAVKALKETKPQHRLYTNVEFYTALTLYYVGIPVDYYPTMFACSRIAGWSAHVMDQFRDNRLIRPRAEYIGPKDLTYVPLSERMAKAEAR